MTVSVMTVNAGVRRRRCVVVVRMRVMWCGGVVVMTRVAVVVVRLVLVAHLGCPQPLFRGHCGEIGITGLSHRQGFDHHEREGVGMLVAECQMYPRFVTGWCQP